MVQPGTAAEDDEPLLPQPRVTRETMQLALRLADVVERMRAESRFNLETFLSASEAGMGGNAVFTAPHGRTRKEVPECRYTSQGFTVGGSWEEFTG